MAKQIIDMTDVTETVDENGKLTIIPSRVTVTNGKRNERFFLYKNISAFIDGKDFMIKSVVNLDGAQTLSGGSRVVYGVQDSHTAGEDWREELNNGLKTYAFAHGGLGGSSLRVFLDEFDGVSLLHRDQIDKSGNVVWYTEKEKVGAIIALDAWIFSGDLENPKGAHVSGFPLSISVTNDIEMPWLTPMSSKFIGFGTVGAYGYTGDMVVDFGGVVSAAYYQRLLSNRNGRH